MLVPIAQIRKLGPWPVLMTGLPTDGGAGLVEQCCSRILHPNFAVAADYRIVGFVNLVLNLLRSSESVCQESWYSWWLIPLQAVCYPAELPADGVVIEVVVLESPNWDFCFRDMERVFPRRGEPQSALMTSYDGLRGPLCAVAPVREFPSTHCHSAVVEKGLERVPVLLSWMVCAPKPPPLFQGIIGGICMKC